jgi:hypothetical protein
VGEPPERAGGGDHGEEEDVFPGALLGGEKHPECAKREDKPAVVAGECSEEGEQSGAGGAGPVGVFAIAEEEPQCTEKTDKEQGFGHRGALEVEQVGIEGVNAERGPGWSQTLEKKMDCKEKEEPAEHIACRGGHHSGPSVVPPGVVAGKRGGEHVGQREPDGTDLFIAGFAGVGETAGDVQMGFGVAVPEGPALVVDIVGGDGGESAEEQEGREGVEPGARTP